MATPSLVATADVNDTCGLSGTKHGAVCPEPNLHTCHNGGMETTNVTRAECRFLLTPVNPTQDLPKIAADMKKFAKMIETTGHIERLESADVYLNDGVGVSFVIVVRVDSWDDAQEQCDETIQTLLVEMGFDTSGRQSENHTNVEPINILGSVLTPA